MSIKRAPRERTSFTIVNNEIFASGQLSFPAMGFLCYLISKPDHWEISVPACINVTQGTRKPFGRDAIYAILDELIAAGYIDRIDTRGENGRRVGVDYVVYETPEGSRIKPGARPLTDKAELAKPLPDQPELARPELVQPDYLVKTDSLAKTEIKKRLITPIVPKPEKPSVEIPDWIPLEAWNGFLEMRKSIKKPLKTAYGVQRAIGNLKKLRDAGNDPAEVLDQSTDNCWSGLFAVKGSHMRGSGQRLSQSAQNAEENAEHLLRMYRGI